MAQTAVKWSFCRSPIDVWAISLPGHQYVIKVCRSKSKRYKFQTLVPKLVQFTTILIIEMYCKSIQMQIGSLSHSINESFADMFCYWKSNTTLYIWSMAGGGGVLSQCPVLLQCVISVPINGGRPTDIRILMCQAWLQMLYLLVVYQTVW